MVGSPTRSCSALTMDERDYAPETVRHPLRSDNRSGDRGFLTIQISDAKWGLGHGQEGERESSAISDGS
jgi:hypothetical protein